MFSQCERYSPNTGLKADWKVLEQSNIHMASYLPPVSCYLSAGLRCPKEPVPAEGTLVTGGGL